MKLTILVASAVVALQAPVIIALASVSADPVIAYPNLRVEVPTNDISISSPSPSTRTLDFTHITWNAGAGPLELRPQYNPSTGQAQVSQALYTLTGPSTWSFVKTVPIATQMTWEPPSDYRFPLTGFGLYSVASNGGVGSLVASSPKVDFCITPDTYVGGVPNTTANPSPPQSDCTDPNGILGLSVGWGDEYDYTDAGNNIDISNLPDGTYWLRAQADPGNYFEQSGPSDTITDTELTITGTTVTVLKQVNPGITPPVVTMTSPSAGASVSGNVTLQASVTDVSPISSVQFLLDGEPIGAPQTTAPYSLTVSTLPGGDHYLSAQAIDANGIIGTAPSIGITVVVPIGTLAIDQQLNATGNTSVTTSPFSTAAPNEILLALVGSDGPGPTRTQTVSVSGAGLTWRLVERANAQQGDSEVWTAVASSPLSNVTVTSTASHTGYDQSLTVVSLEGASGIGASAANGASSGAPTISLTTQGEGSVSFAVGNDYDNAIARTLGSGQTMIAQWLDSSTGDTYWSQYANAPSISAGQTVTLNDTAPTTDQWNLAAVEVLAASSSPPPPPPTVNITSPATGQTVSGSVQVSATATASGAAAITSVQIMLDGQPLGAALTSVPYTTTWNTTTALNGSHSLTAVATDSNGQQATSYPPVTVTVANTSVCFTVDVNVTAHGRGPVTTAAFHTGTSPELLIALVGSDGPGPGQSVKVSGAGLTWRLVQRANASGGDAEIWTATASSVLSNATVTAKQSTSGYDEFLNVISIQGTAGTGAAARASASTGAPHVTLTTTQPQSLVFGVGNDYDHAISRTVGPNQVLLSQWLDDKTGDTYWSQNTSTQTGSAGSSVTLDDTAPTTDQWNMAAVEVLAASNSTYSG